MIVRQRLPQRVVIAADTRVLAIHLHSIKPFDSFEFKSPVLRLSKNKEQWQMTPFDVESDAIYFDVSDTRAMPYKGLYKAKLLANECLIDSLEIIKGASYYVTAKTQEDACATGYWDEDCPIQCPKIERCPETKTYDCGCGAGVICPAQMNHTVYADIRLMAGFV